LNFQQQNPLKNQYLPHLGSEKLWNKLYYIRLMEEVKLLFPFTHLDGHEMSESWLFLFLLVVKDGIALELDIFLFSLS
jgi:hypothetical protein